MHATHNERGTVLIFVTLSIVLLLIMVGMGLDTGHLVFVRAQGQAAVDAAALAAASAIPTGSVTEVNSRAAAFNSKNTYVGSSQNVITGSITSITSSTLRSTGALRPRESPSPMPTAFGSRWKPLILTPEPARQRR